MKSLRKVVIDMIYIQCAARITRHRAASLFPGVLEVFFFSFQDFLDFGSPGSHDFEWFWRPRESFLMIFEYFGCLGTPPGGLGAHFETKARIFVILMTFPREKGRHFWFFFDVFWIQILLFFLSVHFSSFFVIWGARRLQNGSHLEVILRTFFMTGYFLIFATPTVRNLDFWGLEGTQIASFLVTFLRVLSGRPLEHDFSGFWAILGSEWEGIWLQKGIKKWDQKRGQKRVCQ